ncbi:MAG: NADH-quinone oxidoreductase subunit C [Candidatus Eremiobacteraeota bacterium]|nr:NADH-quinone oxidoreductase subunit C [Candidatus Eremiobacteraeota bacterium]
MREDKGMITTLESEPDGKKRVHWECTSSQFTAVASRLKEAQARLITVYATPQGEREVGLKYYFDLEGFVLIVTTRTEKSSISSLYTLFLNADFIEREINNLFRIKFLGHPNLPRYGSTEE